MKGEGTLPAHTQHSYRLVWETPTSISGPLLCTASSSAMPCHTDPATQASLPSDLCFLYSEELLCSVQPIPWLGNSSQGKGWLTVGLTCEFPSSRGLQPCIVCCALLETVCFTYFGQFYILPCTQRQY